MFGPITKPGSFLRLLTLSAALNANCLAAQPDGQNPPDPTLEHHANTSARKPRTIKKEDANPKPAETPVPILPSSEPPAAPDFLALAQAKQAGVTSCTDSLARLLPYSIDAPHEAFSFWAPPPETPDNRLFGSIAGLRYTQPSAPRAAAVIAVVPGKTGKCDGIGVQVLPSAHSCGNLQQAFLRSGKAILTLNGLPLIENPNGQRFLLLPSAGNGCVILAVSTMLGR